MLLMLFAIMVKLEEFVDDIFDEAMFIKNLWEILGDNWKTVDAVRNYNQLIWVK